MPITLSTVSLIYVILPITINEDGSSTVIVKKGYYDNKNNFICIQGTTCQISIADTQTVLSAMPTEGLNRKDDIALAIYQYLISKNLVEQGEIS